MIVRNIKTAEETGRTITSPDNKWKSTRLLLKGDEMGFSFHITTIFSGSEIDMHYQNHLEAVYCVSGEGEVETHSDGKIYPITQGTIYALDTNDKHTLRAFKEMQMACVFNPPLHGKEVHNAEGAYEVEADELELNNE